MNRARGGSDPRYQYFGVEFAHKSCHSVKRSNRDLNLYGIVSEFTLPKKSRGTDWFCVLWLCDDNFHDGRTLKVTLFGANESRLPKVDQWDIIRLHRLKPSYRKEDKSLISSSGWSWLLWKQSEGLPVSDPVRSDLSFSFTQNDRERVKELKNWLASRDLEEMSQELEMNRNVTLDQISNHSEFINLDAIVVGVEKKDDETSYLKVLDGTKLKIPFTHHIRLPDFLRRSPVEKFLNEMSVDITLKDEHVASVKNIYPGSFIRIVGCSVMKNPSYDLILVGGGDRAVIVNDDDIKLHTSNTYMNITDKWKLSLEGDSYFDLIDYIRNKGTKSTSEFPSRTQMNVVDVMDNCVELKQIIEDSANQLFTCYAVVIDAIQPRKSRAKKNYYCIARLIDSSYHAEDGVKLTFHHASSKMLPQLKHRDIIRVENVKWRRKKDDPQRDTARLSDLVPGKNFAWKHWKRSNNYKDDESNICSGEQERNKLSEIVSWIEMMPFEELSQNPIQRRTLTLDAMELNVPFMLNCQVIHVQQVDETLTILQVWDGTTPKFRQISKNTELTGDSTLAADAHVSVFNSNKNRIESIGIKPGSFIRFTNIMATNDGTYAGYKYQRTHFMLFVYGCDAFSRSIQVLDANDPTLFDLKSRISNLPTPKPSTSHETASPTRIRELTSPITEEVQAKKRRLHTPPPQLRTPSKLAITPSKSAITSGTQESYDVDIVDACGVEVEAISNNNEEEETNVEIKIREDEEDGNSSVTSLSLSPVLSVDNRSLPKHIDLEQISQNSSTAQQLANSGESESFNLQIDNDETEQLCGANQQTETSQLLEEESYIQQQQVEIKDIQQQVDVTEEEMDLVESEVASLKLASEKPTVTDEEDSTTQPSTTIREMIEFDLNDKVTHLFRVRAKIILAPRIPYMVFHQCPSSTFMVHARNDGEEIEINKLSASTLTRFREQYSVIKNVKSANISEEEPFSQWIIPKDNESGNGDNETLAMSTYKDTTRGFTWKTLTISSADDNGGVAEVIRKKVCMKSEKIFTIAYLKSSNFTNLKIRMKYDRCVRLSTFSQLTANKIPATVYQDGVFYYCSPATVFEVRIPTAEEEAKFDEISTKMSSGRPIQGLTCPLFDIVYSFRFQLRDDSGSRVNVHCCQHTALQFVDGIQPTEVISSGFKKQQALDKLHSLSSGTLEKEKDEEVWCELMVKKCTGKRTSKEGVISCISYHIEEVSP